MCKMDIFIPDNIPQNEALSRVTHMGIGTHQDDLEIMSLDGILKCFRQPNLWYMGVTVSNGAGAPRDGIYAAYTDAELQEVRRAEQKKAAYLGEYAACAQLMYSSSDIKNIENIDVVADIVKLLQIAQPKVVYTHNLADKHDTHVAVALRVIQAIRSLPASERPEKLYGCEVWRGLDWLCDDDKTIFNVSGHPNISASLMGLYDSQIQAKRYDFAAVGRRRANATFLDSHFTDKVDEAIFGLDMSALMHDENLEPAAFLDEYLNRFINDVKLRVKKYG